MTRFLLLVVMTREFYFVLFVRLLGMTLSGTASVASVSKNRAPKPSIF